jgi:hypothetical protein
MMGAIEIPSRSCSVWAYAGSVINDNYIDRPTTSSTGS